MEGDEVEGGSIRQIRNYSSNIILNSQRHENVCAQNPTNTLLHGRKKTTQSSPRSTRTSVKTTKTTVRRSTTSKRPSTSTRAVTTTKKTTALKTTTITPLSIRVTSTSATSTCVHSTDVLNTSSSTEKFVSEENSTEATTGLKAGPVAGIGVAITVFTAVVVFIFLIIRRSRNRKHHEYKESSANYNLKTAYSTTSVNVDIDNDRLNPNEDGATYFQLEHQADGGADTFSSVSSQVKDTDLSSATAPDASVYCNVHQHNNIESHSIPTPSDFPDDQSGLRHEDVGAKDVQSPSAVDVIYGNLQNNDSDEYNRLRREDGGGTTLRSHVAFVNNYDHLQSGDPGEYNRLCQPRQDGDTQCTILRLPDTYDHLQNSSITNTAPVCTGHDPEKLTGLDTPASSITNYENLTYVTVHNKQYN